MPAETKEYPHPHPHPHPHPRPHPHPTFSSASAGDHTCLCAFSTMAATRLYGCLATQLVAPNFRCLRKYIMQLTTT